MESLHEVSSSSQDAAPASPRPLPGGRAVGVFLVILAVLTSILVFTRSTHQAVTPDNQQKQASTGSSSFALTDKQAIAKFQELNRLRLRAYKQRDLSLIPVAFVPNSAISRTVRAEIQMLLRRSVVPRPKFRTLHLRVILNAPAEVQIEQRVLVGGRFVTQSGTNVTVRPARQTQTIHWTLKRRGSEWRISNSLIVKAVPVGGPGQS